MNSRVHTEIILNFYRHKYHFTCRWANHPHRVLKRFIKTKVPPDTPDTVMSQTNGNRKERKYHFILFKVGTNKCNSK
jgi:hypothetical protein